MAKKRKGARPTRKTSGSAKKTARKAAPRRAAPKTGLEKPGKVDFRPLKDQIGKHIARLEAAKSSNEKIANALTILRQARMDLSRECLPTMELQTS